MVIIIINEEEAAEITTAIQMAISIKREMRILQSGKV
jgi:hypothetical protein